MKKLLLIFPVALMILLNQPSQASAASINIGWNNDHHEKVFVQLPRHASRVVMGGAIYYYSDGTYYTGTPRHYVIVQPPSAVLVSRLPRGHQKIWINGRPYFRHDGIYYTRIQGGFQVVPCPTAVINQQPRVMYR